MVSKVRPCPDLIAKQRSRADVSSAAAPTEHPNAVPDKASASSALDTGSSAPLPPAGTTIPLMQRRLRTTDDVALILQVSRSLVYALARRDELPATPGSTWNGRQ
jgi:hypothetical protein